MSRFCKRLIAAGVILVAGAQFGSADSPSPFEPLNKMRPAVFDWQGPYGGLMFSVKSFKAGLSGTGMPDDVDGSGRLAGIIAGYNFKHGRMVYGLEADAGYGQMRASGPRRLKADLMGTVRARIGLTFEDTLLFTTAGVSFAGVNQTSALMIQGNTSTHLGLVVGGGLEVALARSLTGRLEYLYGHTLEDRNAGLKHLHMIRAGAAYHLPK